MTKKCRLIVSTLLLVLILGVLFAGCAVTKSDTKIMFPETDLALKAAVSDNGGKNSSSLVDGRASSSWKLASGVSAYAEIDFGKEVDFNTVVLKEKSDAINKFRIHAFLNDTWTMVYEQDRIMKIRVCYVEPTRASKLRFEIVESRDNVSITTLEVYNQSKRDNSFKVTDYCTFDYDKDTNTNIITKLKDDPAFTGYFNVITDLIIIGSVAINNNGDLYYENGEDNFAESLESMRYIIANSGHDVKIWCSVLFRITATDIPKETSKMLNKNREKVNASVKAFSEKYGIDGIDYDWEYPKTLSQWRTYDNLILDTSTYSKVSVALPPWGIKLSQKAIDAISIANIMTYDLFDKRGDHSNVYDAGPWSVKQVINAGFKREQIMLGIPTYGRTTNGSGDAWPTYAENPQLGKWGNIVPNFKYKEVLEDKTTKDAACDGYLNGYAMVRDKTLTAIDMNLGGIMVFRAKCDAPYTYEYSLHRAMKEVIDNRIGKK